MIWLQGPIPPHAPHEHFLVVVGALAVEILALGAAYALIRMCFPRDGED